MSDNLFGTPFNLYIEDAVERTEILTSGISAEFGRFTGGVVNAVTPTGGNRLAGSWRTNFSNPSWSTATPLERCADRGRIVPITCRPAAPRPDQMELAHEATLGGPIARDRAWFFGAMQLSAISLSGGLPVTNLPHTQTDTNRRGEFKVTGTASSHMFQGGYANNSTRQRRRPTLSYSIDRFAVESRASYLLDIRGSSTPLLFTKKFGEGPRNGLKTTRRLSMIWHSACSRRAEQLFKGSRRHTLRRTTTLVGAVLAILLSSFAVDSSAQGVQTGSIRGTVSDQQNRPVPGVTVITHSPALQGIRSTASAGDGTYSFLRLPPGRYEMTFEISSFAPVKRSTDVLLGLAVEQNVTLAAAGRTEEVQVVAAAPAPIVNPTVGANYRHEEIQALATPRSLQGIAQLAPGLTENTPNAGQVAINGGFAFDNVFMLNGVDVNDNLFGSPQNLFIEDAIQETQILTSGITAEYGRFTGGVVNAITKSGGNTFSGSWRTNFSNPSWTKTTPLERCAEPGVIVPATCRPAAARLDELQFTHEMTLGGPIVRDKLWFFGAARLSEITASSSLPQTNLQNSQTDTNKRGELKLTGTAASNHTFQGGYLNNSTTQASRPTFGFTIDKFSVGDRTLPNWYGYANYRGILRNDLLVEAQFSQRKFEFVNSGGSLTDIVNSPIITLTQDLGHYNAQYFDATDPESRNNQQFTGNLTYFLNSPNAGRHEFKVGYEFFRSQNKGGHSRSASGYVFDADYATDAAGNALFDSQGYLMPVFVPGATLIENWRPVRGATLNVDNHSIFAQDHVVINNHLSADLGFRYEKVISEATGALIGVDTSTWVPRLAAAYDVQGNGKHIVHVTYGWYAGRYNEAQIGANSNVANPDLLLGLYVGPRGQGRSFAPGFDPDNYLTVFGQFPTRNVFFEEGLSSPVSKEFSASYGVDMLNGRGYIEGTYVHRDVGNIIEDLVDIRNGVTDVVVDGFAVGTFTNVIYANSDVAWRQYDGLLFQGRFNLTNHWTLNGHYTLQLKNDGNYEGEAASQPGVSGRIGDYPEIFRAARHFPDGHVDGYQRHKVRLWTIYNVGVGQFGDASLSGLWRIDSGTPFSYAATGQGFSTIQDGLLAAAGYPDGPSDQTIYFGERGAGQFRGFSVLDVAATYNVPVFRTLRPYVNLSIYNALNNQKLIRWNTTVAQDPDSAPDELGLSTGFVRGSVHGLANNNNQFPVPSIGGTGGRTWRLAVGFRF